MTTVLLWPIAYGARALAMSAAAPVAVVLIPDALAWECCTAARTGADNDARWRDPGDVDVHGERQ